MLLLDEVDKALEGRICTGGMEEVRSKPARANVASHCASKLFISLNFHSSPMHDLGFRPQ